MKAKSQKLKTTGQKGKFSSFQLKAFSPKLPQAGDTIVEVMVAIVIAGVALAAAYQLSNASLRTSTQAAQRSQALSYGSSQIERLKDTYYTNPSNFTLAKTTVDFCLDSGENIISAAADPSNCLVYGTPFTAIDHYDSTANSFSFTVSWPNINGHGNDQQVLYYRFPS